MFRKLPIYILILIVVVSIIFIYINPFKINKSVKIKPHDIVYGVVDPEKSFDDVTNVSIEHSFLAWKRDDSKDLNKELDLAIAKHREPLVTIEPWSFTQKGDTLFKDITSGDYKSTIESMCLVADSKNTPIIFRWGHEMDYAGSSRYPWANKDYGGFINAFRYWVSTCRGVLMNKKISFMWSPGGKEGLDKYYPGDEYVDMIGLSLYGYPEYEKKTIGHTQSFNEVMDQKYGFVEKYNKPIYLAEMGVAGTTDYKKQWIDGMFKSIKTDQRYPLLYGLIYFQYGDANPWVPGIVAPNFRIDTTLFPPRS
jgi:endoglucanase